MQTGRAARNCRNFQNLKFVIMKNNFLSPRVLEDARNPMFPCPGGTACYDGDTGLPLPCQYCFGLGVGSTSRHLGNTRKLNKARLNYLNANKGGGGCSGGCGCGGSCGNGNHLNSPGRFRNFSPGMARFGYNSRNLQR